MMADAYRDADAVRWMEPQDRGEGKMVEALVYKVCQSGNGRTGPDPLHIIEINTVLQDGK